MKKIVLIPLDERPCTYNYPNMLASMAKDSINVVEVPKEYMGDLKIPGNIDKIAEFLLEECKDADYANIAIDTLLYGGIVPSRLHYETEETLLNRLQILRKIKEINPKIKIFAFHLIMRCPSYNGNDEEPDYYELCGRNIHMLGHYQHLSQVRKLDEKEQNDYDAILKNIKDNDYQKYVDDYLYRRKINTKMNIHTLDLLLDNTIDFLVIPQDDSAPYGYTALDQIIVRQAINEKKLQLKTYMYPDADGVSNTLLARAINEINGVKPKVFVRYSSCNEGNLIPEYEDRPVCESIKYQILAAGGIPTLNFSESDIVLMVNVPLKDMKGAVVLYNALHRSENPGETDLNYTVGRNLVEYVEWIKYLISIKKCVVVADIAYSNGGDTILFNLMKNEHILFKVDSYAGWNTSANSLATCIPLGMIKNIYGASQEFYDFMGLRYLEDVGYMSNVRHDAFNLFRNEFKWKQIDGKEDGKVATYIKNSLIKWAKENLTDEGEVSIVKHEQPWNRFFETGLIVHTEMKK